MTKWGVNGAVTTGCWREHCSFQVVADGNALGSIPCVYLCHVSMCRPLSTVNCLQAAELLKLLLDPETMDTPVEKNDFLESFYDK